MEDDGSNRSGIRKKPRILCLHGFRSSWKILKDRIYDRWPENVVGELDLVFGDAPFPAEGGASSVDGTVYEWFQSDQGAFLASALPGIQKEGVAFSKVHRIKFLILIAGGKFGHDRFGTPIQVVNAFASQIECPSLHIIGEQDSYVLKDDSQALLSSFVDPTVIYHPEGHTIPKLSLSLFLPPIF